MPKVTWSEATSPFSKKWLCEQINLSYSTLYTYLSLGKLEGYFENNKLANDRLKEITGYDVSEIDFGK